MNANQGTNPVLTPSEDLARVFNTAIISTQAESSMPPEDYSKELLALVNSQAFQSILGAIKDLAAKDGTSTVKAAETLIQTFRKIDKIWKDYVFLQGVAKIKNSD